MNEIIQMSQSTTTSWAPVSGPATNRLCDYLVSSRELGSAQDFVSIETAARKVLSNCLPPTETSGQKTGLVVGYVQSGKTLSMTTLATLAHDNGYGLVIVLAGTTDNLLDQSWKRFQKYLRADERRRWFMLSSADGGLELSSDQVQTAMRGWTSKDIPRERRQAVFLTVMKQHVHLRQLGAVLARLHLENVPVLVIDDEADQAGLNTKPDTGESTTYAQIRAVRARLGAHTYVQYTATPQAPLLINLIDMLSPDFCTVLPAGPGYTGGKRFFLAPTPSLIHSIPNTHLPPTPKARKEAPLAALDDGPPESLLEALRVFFAGLAYADLKGPSGKNRSMLVHPSPQRADHDRYYVWVTSAQDRWREALSSGDDAGDSGPDDLADMREEFQTAIEELRKTVPDMPSFDELLPSLRVVLPQTVVAKVNSETGVEVSWENAYGHILVGGQKLNRGYTVEGLTVTYMPRSPGGWNADTIQQLARFFGYKEKYIGLCRVLLHEDVRDAFRWYVRHEEDLREQLSEFTGPLKTWKREFFLAPRMRPTRATVLSNDLYRPKTGWLVQDSPHDADIVNGNIKLRDELFANIGSTMAPHPRSDRHRQVSIPLADALQWLLDYRTAGDEDGRELTAARLWLNVILERDPDAVANIVDMGSADRTSRNGKVIKLHQGYDRKSMGAAYPGAEKIRDASCVTIQVYALRVTEEGTDKITPVAPTLAIYVPPSLIRSEDGLAFQDASA